MSKISIIPPRTKLDSYNQNSDIQFDLTYVGNSLKRGSVKIVGELQVLNGVVPVQPAVANNDIKYDSVLGVHGLFRQITSEINGQVIETIDNYPMYVKAMYASNNFSWDFMSSVTRNQALQIGNDSISTALIAKTSTGTEPDLVWNSFCVSPFIALNKSDVDISGQKGNSKVTLYLNQISNFLYGDDVATGKYSLRNVYLIYETVADSGNNLATMEKIYYIPQTLSSNNQQYSMNLPIACNGVSVVFHDSKRPATTNSYELEALPNVTSVSFSYNDVSNAYIKYNINTLQEMLLNYMNSWKVPMDSKNMFSLFDYYTNGLGFGLGMNFGGDIVSLKNQTWGMNIQSGVTREYTAHIIFHGVIQV